MFPPLTQILGARSYRPMCCSLGNSFTSALGTVQIMVGLFNIGLGPGRTSTHPEDLTSMGAAYWLGAVFITSGIVSLLSRRSACWVGFTAFVNIVAGIFAIVGIALYVTDLRDASVAWMCNNSTDSYDNNCVYVAQFAQKLLTGMDIALIVMGVLQLCVCITVTVFCIMALCGSATEEPIGEDSPESVVKEVLTSPAA